ncbi:hypothetical protein ASPSYDRAFT_84030 [Aspergillus sydowii CBS 593.65]|uniref:Nascent polypeptide-associated complex subunit alpha-like UBA domain-containing protein n=1 Tax=Aspergillus sydowii CBS 593.65 TaxID=1036612 RepID=A0A1L9TX33_9EURO|nr:uncharacterized protein ASPSYDRAFT_84030 [Aspergillus sydowii CBS 593.65]OJJ63997.1 hypothetical protein ASPSYDRAFT_84030 [Aspergillus sydowii CBS 593.65]
MSDPIPSAAPTEPTNSTSAEDRKAAAALSSLNTTEITSEPAATSGAKQPSSADQEALGKAMSRLEIAAGGHQKTSAKAAGKSEGAGAEVGKKKAAPAVKIAGEDVSLLVNELDLSKVKATELLRANEGDAKKAIRAFIRPPPTLSAAAV